MKLLSWLKKNLAKDDAWITVHPNTGAGRPVLLDDEGYIKGGMGGKFNGQRIDLIPRKSGYGTPVSEVDPLNQSTPGFLRTDRYKLKAPENVAPQATNNPSKNDTITKPSQSPVTEPPQNQTLSTKLSEKAATTAAKELEAIRLNYLHVDGEQAAQNFIASVNKMESVISASNVPDFRKENLMDMAVASAAADARVELLQQRIDNGAKGWGGTLKKAQNFAMMQGAIVKGFIAKQTGKLKEFPEKLGGVKRGAPMTHEQADGNSPNPDYGRRGGDTNCQTCVSAYEMRLRGYNVKAGLNSSSTTPQEALSKDPSRAWVNPETGLPPSRIPLDGNDASHFVMGLRNEVRPGQRYHLSVKWKGPGAHIITVQKDNNGNLRIYDPQTGGTYTGDDAIMREYGDRIRYNYMSGNGRRWPSIYRVDNCYPNEDVMNAVLKKGEKM